MPRHNSRTTRAGVSTAQALLSALELHDPYSAEHCRHTVELAEAVAERLGLDTDERRDVRLVAMLHDVGKLGMPQRILNKPRDLTAAERRLVREHPAAGAYVVEQVEELAHLARAIRAGHERWDGRGYPDRLAGEAIPIASRITFVCDAYDAMISQRPYREPMGPAQAREELRRCAGTQFCARCVEALLDILAPAEARLAHAAR